MDSKLMSAYDAAEPARIKEATQRYMALSLDELAEERGKLRDEAKTAMDVLKDPETTDGDSKRKLIHINSDRMGLNQAVQVKRLELVNREIEAQEDRADQIAVEDGRLPVDGSILEALKTGNQGVETPLHPPTIFDLLSKGNPAWEGKSVADMLSGYCKGSDEARRAFSVNCEDDKENFEALRAFMPHNQFRMAATTTANQAIFYPPAPGLIPEEYRPSTAFMDALVVQPADQMQVRVRKIKSNYYTAPEIAFKTENIALDVLNMETEFESYNLERIGVGLDITDELQYDLPRAEVWFTEIARLGIRGKLNNEFLYGNATPPRLPGLDLVTGTKTTQLFTPAAQAGQIDYLNLIDKLYDSQGTLGDAHDTAPTTIVLRPSAWYKFISAQVTRNANLVINFSQAQNQIARQWDGMNVILDRQVKAQAASTTVGYMLNTNPLNIVIRMLGGYMTEVTRSTPEARAGRTAFTFYVRTGLQVDFPESVCKLVLGAAANPKP